MRVITKITPPSIKVLIVTKSRTRSIPIRLVHKGEVPTLRSNYVLKYFLKLFESSYLDRVTIINLGKFEVPDRFKYK